MYLNENYTIENFSACLGCTGGARARLEGQVKAKDTENCPLTTIARGMLTSLIRTLKDFFGLHFIRLQYSFVHDIRVKVAAHCCIPFLLARFILLVANTDWTVCSIEMP